MRVAVIGAGISGLVVAHLLHPRHDITVFEAGAYAGGHTNTVRVDTGSETHDIDTGFIVFNDRNYPNFERLLSRLGVASQPSNMSFSVSDEDGRFEYSSTSLAGLFATPANRVNPAFHRMVAEVPRFQRECRALLAEGSWDLPLADWLRRERFSEFFIQRLIVPQAAAVWSADPRQMWSFPARFLAEFFHNHGMLALRSRPRWRVVSGGSARYVDALTRPFVDRLRLRTPVGSITRAAEHVLVSPAGQEPERFDEVVIATHSDQALAMLSDASATERELLGAIPYVANEAVLHTDTRLLPRRRPAWASWNYHLLEEPRPAAAVTYHMNRLQSLSSQAQFCVTLNRTEAIDPAHVIRTINYAHPVFTPAGVRAQARAGEISGANRTHFAGAYWGWGFHEDGVVSGLRVAERFGAGL
jgi:uncharacterized protein